MLLSRPQIQQDECVISYLIRVSESNGFKHVGYLLHYAGLPWKNRRIPVHQILTGEFDSSIYFNNLGLEWRCPDSAKLYQEFHRVIDTPHIFNKFPKVCPYCIDELGYCKNTWAFLPVLVCSKHKTLLIDTDVATGERLSWYREKLVGIKSFRELNYEFDHSTLSSLIRLSEYSEAFIKNKKYKGHIPVILHGLNFREALSLINFLAHYESLLKRNPFKPVSMDTLSLSQEYIGVWKMLEGWPDSFYSMLSLFIDRPMSRKGVSGINKHYRDIHERLHRQSKNLGIARVKTEFDRYIEAYWPGIIDSNKVKRIKIDVKSRDIISKKEAARRLNCRPERIDKLVKLNKLSRIIFEGKANYNRQQVDTLAQVMASNWTMAQAAEALQITRYQLKQLLDAQIIEAIQRPDQFNRDWVVNKEQCLGLVDRLLSKNTVSDLDDVGWMKNGAIQRKGYSIARLIKAMLNGQVKYRVQIDNQHPYSMLQFISFKIN